MGVLLGSWTRLAVVGALLAVVASWGFTAFFMPECGILTKLYQGRLSELNFSFIACSVFSSKSFGEKLFMCRSPCNMCDDLHPQAHEVSTGSFMVRDILVNDLDGDGQKDDIARCERAGYGIEHIQLHEIPFHRRVKLAVLKWILSGKEFKTRATVFVSLNQGVDTPKWTTVPVGTQHPFADCRAISSGDVDLDGDIDLTLTDRQGGRVLWYENKNGGLEWVEHEIKDEKVPFPAAENNIAHDIDLDGDMDLIVSTGSPRALPAELRESQTRFAHTIFLVENLDGKATEWKVHTIARIFEPISLDIADLDRDGRPDVLFASRNVERGNLDGSILNTEESTGWIRNIGNIEEVTWPVTLLSAVQPGKTYGVDFDKNGFVDIFYSAHSENNIAVQFNDGKQLEYKVVVPDGWPMSGPKTVEPYDMDGDGDFDLVVGSFYNSFLIWFENITPANSTDYQWVRHILSECEPGITRVFPADIDGDGEPEIVWALLEDPGSVRYMKALKTNTNRDPANHPRGKRWNQPTTLYEWAMFGSSAPPY